MIETATIETAAALLDDIASGTLTQGDFYKSIELAGYVAADLESPLVNKANKDMTREDITVILAAECLKDLCTATDPARLMIALISCRSHVRRLHKILNDRTAK